MFQTISKWHLQAFFFFFLKLLEMYSLGHKTKNAIAQNILSSLRWVCKITKDNTIQNYVSPLEITSHFVAAERKCLNTKNKATEAILEQHGTDQGQPQERKKTSMEGKKTVFLLALCSAAESRGCQRQRIHTLVPWADSCSCTTPKQPQWFQDISKVCRLRWYLLLDQCI